MTPFELAEPTTLKEAIALGGSARVSSTVTLKLNFMYATLVSNTAA